MPNLFSVYAAVGAMLLPVFACTVIGIEWGRRRLSFPGGFISTFVTSVAVPGLVFNTLATTRLDNDALARVALAAIVGTVVMGGLSAALLRLRNLPVRQLAPTSTFPNAGNLGLPL